jgi:hypothetical protein
MDLEFDPAKSEANRAKHGIDFHEAIALWGDENRLEIPARTTDEPRSMVVGRIAGRHWSAVVTYRGEKTRIVSVRRSRPEEVRLYEGQGD